MNRALVRVVGSRLPCVRLSCPVLREPQLSSNTRVAVWGRVEQKRGVRQGDPLSPFLFNLVLDEALDKIAALPFGVPLGVDGDSRCGCRSWLSRTI